jgi:hypothetical protein
MLMRFKGEGGDFRELDTETIDELRPVMAALVGEAVDIAYTEMVTTLSRPGRSQPGDPPGMRSGELVRSLKKSKPTGRAKLRQRGAVYTRLFWATVQEFGGRIGKAKEKIAPRPSWRPVFERIEPRIDRLFRGGL